MLWTQITYVKCFLVGELGCDIIDMCIGTFTKATGEDYSVEPTDSRRPFRFVLDVDLIRTSTGNRVFGALKGALDGGLDVPHSEKRFAGFKKDDKQLDAEMHHNYIFGGHVANHMRYMIEEDQRNTTHTSVGTSSKQGVDANNMEEVYKKVHAAIRADPMLVKSTKEPPKENKRFNLKKHTYDERKKGLIERMNALNERAGADDMDDDDDDDEDDE